MKTLLLTTMFVTQLIGHCVAGLAVLPEIPVPKLTASQALAIAQQQMTNATGFTLVGIEWCKSSAFQPRFNDGTHWWPGDDHPDEYSWFVTYVYKDEQLDERMRRIGIKRRFNEVCVIRVRDDGQIGRFDGFRT